MYKKFLIGKKQKIKSISFIFNFLDELTLEDKPPDLVAVFHDFANSQLATAAALLHSTVFVQWLEISHTAGSVGQDYEERRLVTSFLIRAILK